MSHRLIYVTAPNMDEAQRLGRMAVEARLAACANILPGMQSIYWWKESLETAQEVVLLLKTTAELTEPLTKALTLAHSYECPCVVCLPIEGGNPAFLKWIEDETI